MNKIEMQNFIDNWVDEIGEDEFIEIYSLATSSELFRQILEEKYSNTIKEQEEKRKAEKARKEERDYIDQYIAENKLRDWVDDLKLRTKNKACGFALESFEQYVLGIKKNQEISQRLADIINNPTGFERS